MLEGYRKWRNGWYIPINHDSGKQNPYGEGKAARQKAAAARKKGGKK